VRLGVALFLLFELLLESAALLQRVIQLAEGVGHLEPADVHLEALDGVGVVCAGAVVDGFGGELDGVAGAVVFVSVAAV
jgi:hypothetical protein